MNDPKFKAITDRFFWESFFGIFIFGIPAFSALFLGKALDSRFDSGSTWKIILLVSAFVLSWIIVFYRNKKVTRMYREFRETQKNLNTTQKSEDVKTQ